MNFDSYQFTILFGLSGTGKSEILGKLQDMGEQVLDLESLANHNGSSFGGLGREKQPNQETFNRLIKEKLRSFSEDKPVWMEYESNYIGKLQIPDEIDQKMLMSDMLVLRLEKENRIDRIVEMYADYETEELLGVTHKLKKKLSPKKYRLARRSILQKDYKTAASIFLTYYDKIYENQLKILQTKVVGEVQLTGNSTEEFADQVFSFYQTSLLKSRNQM
jgi:tRNA 2-selenouridine synthase